MADSDDVIKYENAYVTDYDCEQVHQFEMYMYCDYTKQTKSLTECSIGILKHEQTDTIIATMIIYFKECNTAFFDLINMTGQFETMPINEPYLKLTACYVEFVHSRDNPFRW